MSFYTRDAIRIVYNGGMIKGLDAIRKLDAPYVADPATVLNWQPLEAHVYSDIRHHLAAGERKVAGSDGHRAS